MQLVQNIISNLKYFQPSTNLGTDQQRQHSILPVFWWWGSYQLQLCNKTTCHCSKYNLCSKL